MTQTRKLTCDAMHCREPIRESHLDNNRGSHYHLVEDCIGLASTMDWLFSRLNDGEQKALLKKWEKK